MDEETDESPRHLKAKMKCSMQVGSGLVVAGILLLLATNTILKLQVNNVIFKLYLL